MLSVINNKLEVVSIYKVYVKVVYVILKNKKDNGIIVNLSDD